MITGFKNEEEFINHLCQWLNNNPSEYGRYCKWLVSFFKNEFQSLVNKYKLNDDLIPLVLSQDTYTRSLIMMGFIYYDKRWLKDVFETIIKRGMNI